MEGGTKFRTSLVGDVNGNGYSNPVCFDRKGYGFYSADMVNWTGVPNQRLDTPIIGDWDGNGIDDVGGLYRGRFYRSTDLGQTWTKTPGKKMRTVVGGD